MKKFSPQGLWLLVLLFVAQAVLAQSGSYSITNYQKVSEARVSFTEVEYTYKADVVNNGDLAKNVSATVVSQSSHTKIVADTLTFGDVPANSTKTSANTFKFRQDRRYAFSFGDLVWTVNGTRNRGPIANAGPAQTVHVSDVVTLNGAGSSDPDGNPLAFSWSFVNRPTGSTATLSNPTSLNPTFLVDKPGDYIVQLVVNDGTVDSAPSQVTISTMNSAPVANAGPDQTKHVGEIVQLDGGASSDVDGDPLTYAWSFTERPNGSTAALTSVAITNPTFVVDRAGTYKLQLVVNDGQVSSPASTVTISTVNTPPVANPGSAQTAHVGSLVQLNGSASTDVDGDPLTYAWSFVSRPSGSAAAMSDPTLVAPTFTADEIGTYVVQLIVNDGLVDSTPVTVSISTTNSAPTANAGTNQTVALGSVVTLDGSGSHDNDGDTLTYHWALTSIPTGSTAVLSDPNSQTPVFTVDQPGSYIAQLIVNDGFVNSQPATVTITTANSKPVANAGSDQSVDAGTTVTLNGTGSSDPDGNSISYHWSFTSRPAGSTAVLSDATSAQPTFVADLGGSYVIQLIVNDGTLDSLPDTVMVTATAIAPPAIEFNPASLSFGEQKINTSTKKTVTIHNAGGTDLTISGINVTGDAAADYTFTPNTFPMTIAGGANASLEVTFTPSVLGSRNASLSVEDNAGGPHSVPLSGSGADILTIATSDPLVGVGRTINGTVTLGVAAPAGGRTINLASSNSGIASVSPSTVTIAEGELSGSFTVTGVAPGGPITLTASSSGYADATTQLTVTELLISFGNIPVVAPGQSVSLPISLSSPAPTGGVTINFTTSNSAIATITPSVFVPAGAVVPSANPQVTGVGIGSTTVFANAGGFAPDSRPVTVSVTASFGSATVNVPATNSTTVALNISAPAPAGGITFTLSTDDAGIATVPASVTIAAGSTSAQVSVNGVAVGTTAIHANSTGIAQANATVKVGAAPSISVGGVSLGKDLQAAFNVSLSVAAPIGGVDVTISSSDSSKLLVAANSTTPGSDSVVVHVSAGTTTVGTFYAQALAGTGTANVVVSAPGYQTQTTTASLYPSGFIIDTPSSINTNTFASNTNVRITSARLTPTLAYSANQSLRPGIGPISVEVTSSNTSVGTMTTSPVVFNGGDGIQNTGFHPLTAGSSNITISAPVGFSTSTNYQQIAATVTAPNINVSNVTVGKDLQTSMSIGLQSAPPSPVTVTVTSNNPAIALVSNGSATAGSSTVTFTNVNSTTVGTLWVQGLAVGTTTLTISAPGYNNATSTVTVDPSGFVIDTPSSINTNTFASNTNVRITSARLTSALAYAGNQSLRAGIGPINIDVTSSDTSVGTITTSPLVFNGGDGVQITGFDPLAAGSTTVKISAPAGFSTPTNYQQISATVTAPAINVADLTVGKDLQVAFNVSLAAAAPAGGVDVTISSSDSTKLLISSTSTAVGTGTIVVHVPATQTGVGTLYAQALVGSGSATINVSAPGFTTKTATVTLQASGFVIDTPSSINTTTFAANSNIRITSARLNSSLAYAGNQSLRPGIGPISIDVTSSNGSVGTITTSPVVFNGGDSLQNTSFHPLTAGSSNITISTPAGFSTPTNYQQIPATVSAPNISIGNVDIGKDLQTSLSISLQSAPPNPVTVTVTSNGPAIAVISDGQTVVGGSTVTFTNVSSTSVGTIWVQGLAVGTTTLTVSAPGYNNATSTVTVDPSGFIIDTPSSINTKTSSANSTIRITSARLNPSTLAYSANQALRAGVGPISVDVTSSNTTVGTITISPLVFNGGDSQQSTAFDPVSVGSSNITISAPAGFSTPGNYQQITATVSQ